MTLDFETEVCSTIGAKEGFSHLMLALVGPGDTALVPSPSYPIHIWGPILAGAGVHYVRMGPGQNFFENMRGAYEQAWPRPRVIVTSFPHNPTTACVDLEFMAQLVEFARERDIVVVHDFAYADLGFDGYEPPSILQVPGAKDVAVELYTMTKSFSMAGWRMGFLVGNAEIVAALAKLKSYLDYGSFQPIQIAATVAMNEAPDFPKEVNEIYRGRRDALIDGLDRLGWHIEKPKGTMFVWARDSRALRGDDEHRVHHDVRAGGEGRARRPGRASGPAARATCASRSSRTRSASSRPCARSARVSRSSAEQPAEAVEAERDAEVGDLVDRQLGVDERVAGQLGDDAVDRVREQRRVAGRRCGRRRCRPSGGGSCRRSRSRGCGRARARTSRRWRRTG